VIEHFSIYRLDREMKRTSQLKIEQEGMLQKSWFFHPELGECLFKKSAPPGKEIIGCQTDWSEKVAYELARILGISAARYELAEGEIDFANTELTRGSISTNYIPLAAKRITGESFLSNYYPDYQAEYPASYRVEKVLKALKDRQVGLPTGYRTAVGINSGAELFVGYLMLDTWIGNDDRHDCNFEVIGVEDRLELAPTFDHGKGFGATLNENTRSKISVQSYHKYLESGFWQDDRKISTLAAFEAAVKLMPEAGRIWQKRLAKISSEKVTDIFRRIPNERIDSVSTKFAKNLLDYNKQKILDINIKMSPKRLTLEREGSEKKTSSSKSREPKQKRAKGNLEL
jgi:hypothetical protein